MGNSKDRYFFLVSLNFMFVIIKSILCQCSGLDVCKDRVFFWNKKMRFIKMLIILLNITKHNKSLVKTQQNNLYFIIHYNDVFNKYIILK